MLGMVHPASKAEAGAGQFGRSQGIRKDAIDLELHSGLASAKS